MVKMDRWSPERRHTSQNPSSPAVEGASGGGEMEANFWHFHLAHTEVYRTLVRFARQWRERLGVDAVCGIGALYERARWEMRFESLDDAPSPKLSNNHRAFYARLIMEREKDLDGIFHLKRQQVQATFGPDNQTLEPSSGGR